MQTRLFFLNILIALGLLAACETPPPAANSSGSLTAGWAQLREADRVSRRTEYTGTVMGQPARLWLAQQGERLSGALLQADSLPVQGHWEPGQPPRLVLDVMTWGETDPQARFLGSYLPGGQLMGEWSARKGREQGDALFQPVAWQFFLTDSLLPAGRLEVVADTFSLEAPDSAGTLTFAYPICAGLANHQVTRTLTRALGPPARQELGDYMAYLLSLPDSVANRYFVRTFELHALLPGWLSLSYFYTGPDTAYSRSVLANLTDGSLAAPGYLLGSAWPEGLVDRVQDRLRQERGQDWEVDFSQLPQGMHLEVYPHQLVVRLDPLALGSYAPETIRLAFSYAELGDLIPAEAPLAQLMPVH